MQRVGAYVNEQNGGGHPTGSSGPHGCRRPHRAVNIADEPFKAQAAGGAAPGPDQGVSDDDGRAQAGPRARPAEAEDRDEVEFSASPVRAAVQNGADAQARGGKFFAPLRRKG